MKTLYQKVLPSGRAVRVRRLDTETYLAIQQRVALKIGDRKDAGGGLARTLSAAEIAATCVVAVTTPLPWLYKAPEAPEASLEAEASEDDPLGLLPPAEAKKKRRVVDVDAMLNDEHVKAHGGWAPLAYGDLMSRGDKGLKTLFSDFRDFNALMALIVPDDDEDTGLLGKEAQVVSVE